MVTLKPQTIALSTELPGRTTAYLIADVRPQVNGVITKRLFTEGSDVQAGQQLYQIDPATYQAAYDSARATLAHDQAALRTARAKTARYTLIPTIAVPVVLLGTFGVLAVLGYSINTLTMLAMVLAVGLLVDDAIVVVENVQRVMAEENLSPRDATRKSMRQISGALVGIALVLSAVFLPMAFLSGSTGVIYRQVSVTIVSAMILSVLVALILTPALCATLLKAPKPDARPWRVFTWFNRGFDWLNARYTGGVGRMIGGWLPSLLVFGVIAGGMAFLFLQLPSGFLPDEDQGILYGQVSLPPGSTAEQTQAVNTRVVDYILGAEKANVASSRRATRLTADGGGARAIL